MAGQEGAGLQGKNALAHKEDQTDRKGSALCLPLLSCVCVQVKLTRPPLKPKL